MNADQLAVESFMKSFGQVVRTTPTIPTDEEADLRISLLDEEVQELREAFVNQTKVDIADALADILYVLLGTASTCGMDLGRIFSEVHRSNMSKFWKSNEVADLLNRDAQEVYQYIADAPLSNEEFDCRRISKVHWTVKNKEGKIIKSPSYSPADIVSCLS